MRISRRWFVIWMLVQGLTLALLIALCWHYRVVPKLVRTLIDERRAPLVNEDFRRNRNYDPQREIFRLYPASGARGYLLGDSQVAGVCWLELMPWAGIVGRGIPGDTAEGVLHRIEDLAESRPEWIGVLVGTNDILRGGDPREVAESILGCVERLRRGHPEAVIAVVSIPPLARWVEQAERRNGDIGAANRAVSEAVSGLTDARWIDLAGEVADENGYLQDLMTTDGVHLSAAAYRRLLHGIEATLPEGSPQGGTKDAKLESD